MEVEIKFYCNTVIALIMCMHSTRHIRNDAAVAASTASTEADAIWCQTQTSNKDISANNAQQAASARATAIKSSDLKDLYVCVYVCVLVMFV